MSADTKYLDPTRMSEEDLALKSFFDSQLIGQEHVISKLLPAFKRFRAGLNNRRRPIGTFLLLGPTGVGKTHTAELLATFLYGNPDAMTKIDCTEFTQDHEVAKLGGSPPGYEGHKTVGRLKQSEIDKFNTDKYKIPIVLFDEIEKAAPAMEPVLVGATGNGCSYTCGDNTKTSFANTIFFLTSNLGSAEMDAAEKRKGFGKGTPFDSVEVQVEKERGALAAAQKHWSPEFMGRIKPIVYRSLREPELRQIIHLQLADVQKLLLTVSKSPYVLDFRCPRLVPEARDQPLLRCTPA
jgi:ATP-dependent Clp protease ATP-binding subunit ClpB